MTKRTELLEFMASGENSGVEFQRDDVHPQDLVKELVALSNLEGGKVVLGVEDDGTITGLVGHELDKLGVEVAHILPDAALQSHEAAMDELLDRFPSCGPSLLDPDKSRADQVAATIAEQAKIVGHRIDKGVSEPKRGQG